MNLTWGNAAEIEPFRLAALFNQAFKGYIGGSINFNTTTFLGWVCREGVDLSLSRVAIQDSEPVAFGLIARLGRSSRVAVMGVIPEVQGQHVGRQLMTQLISECRTRGERTLVLEAFEQNLPAVTLYKNCGFRIVRRLSGYQADSLADESSDALEEIDSVEAARVIMAHGATDLPWQIGPIQIARSGPPSVVYRLDQAQIVLTDPQNDTIAIRALIVPPAFRLQGQAARLLRAVAARHPGKKWRVPPICPEEYGSPFFEKQNFMRDTLNQVQMQLDLV